MKSLLADWKCPIQEFFKSIQTPCMLYRRIHVYRLLMDVCTYMYYVLKKMLPNLKISIADLG